MASPRSISTQKDYNQGGNRESSGRPKGKNPVGGFTEFLRENGIVGLAVGFVVGTQVQSVVKQLTSSFIDPLSSLLVGGKALSSRTFTLHFSNHYANFAWGALVYILIDFLFVLLVVYLLIRLLKLHKLDKSKS